MRNFLLCLSLLVLLAGCGGRTGGRSHENFYLRACYFNDDQVVFVDITLPPGYYGILSETTTTSLGHVALSSDTYNLGFFAPGTYTFKLELLSTGESDDLDGYAETCTIVIGDPDELPPVPPPCVPSVAVNVNEDGGVLFRIDGCWEDCTPVFELFLADEVFDFSGNKLFLFPFLLEPGDYFYDVRIVGDCGNSSILTGIIIIVGPVPPGPPNDILPHAWGLHKILVCVDGESRLVPYPVASRLVGDGKATLGECRDDDDHGDDD